MRNDLTVFENDAALRHAHDHRHILFDDDDRHAFPPIDFRERDRDLLNQKRHDAIRWQEPSMRTFPRAAR